MKFYLNEHGLRMVNADGSQGWVLLDDGTWKPYSGYDQWPPHKAEPRSAAKIEARFTGLVEKVPLPAPEEALIAPWAGPGDNSPIETPEQHMAKRAGRNL